MCASHLRTVQPLHTIALKTYDRFVDSPTSTQVSSSVNSRHAITLDLTLDDGALEELCKRHGVKRLSLFGSALGNQFNADSDIDILVEFWEGQTIGFLEIAEFELELSRLLDKREVEIRTARDLSPLFREQVQRETRGLYAA